MSDRIDETIPGGYYIGADGVPHDAHGRPIDVEPEPVKTDGEADGQPDTGELSEPERPVEALADVGPEPEVRTKKGKGK